MTSAKKKFVYLGKECIGPSHPSCPIKPHRASVLEAILTERNRQEELKRSGKFPHSCADTRGSILLGRQWDPRALAHAGKLAILAEEFGEVARHVTECTTDWRRYSPVQLRDELIQVSAVAAAWAEAIQIEDDEYLAIDWALDLDHKA